jgi:antitoxin MazE
MQVSKWGNSLAVRLPADLVRRLGLREGDEISLHAEEGGLAVLRQPRPDEVLADLRRFRGRLDPVNRLDRDSANAR